MTDGRADKGLRVQGRCWRCQRKSWIRTGYSCAPCLIKFNGRKLLWSVNRLGLVSRRPSAERANKRTQQVSHHLYS